MRVPWRSELSSEENHEQAARKMMERFDWEGELIGGTLRDGSLRKKMTCT